MLTYFNENSDINRIDVHGSISLTIIITIYNAPISNMTNKEYRVYEVGRVMAISRSRSRRRALTVFN